MQLIIPHKDLEIVVTGEAFDTPRYDERSADNACPREEERFLGDDGCRPSSRHRVSVKQGKVVLGSLILLATGGASSVHTHSTFVRNDICFIAVGSFVCALALPTLQLIWQTPADSATCFGVYDSPKYASIISHGELEIARLDYSGQVLWSASGRDIFSEGFTLHQDYAEAIDFEGTRYRFELETGQSCIVTG